MHLPRRTTVTAAALAVVLAGPLAGCSDAPDAADQEITDVEGAEPGVDAAEPGVDEEAPDAPAIDVEPTPE